MKLLFETRARFLVLLIAGFQLISASCSRQLYNIQSFHNIESKAEKKRLTVFLDEGTENAINSDNTTPDEIINIALQYLGVPHCMGGTSMKCMDCSGLLSTVFSKQGIYLPHNSEEQARYGKIITEMKDLVRGDLVFFIRSYKTDLFITHSGIYIGNDKFIHASTSKGVTVTSLYDRWWNEKFIFGTRVFSLSPGKR